ncbi:hypothetical protein ACFX12_017751 [Malus domestica]
MPPSYAHQERLPAFCMNGEFLGRDIRFNLVNQLDDVPEIRMSVDVFRASVLGHLVYLYTYESMALVDKNLKEIDGIEYVKRGVEEGGINCN